MTITSTDAVVLVTLGFAVFAYRLFRPARATEQPGPHNDWRRTGRGGGDSSFHESGAGMTGGGDGGHY